MTQKFKIKLAEIFLLALQAHGSDRHNVFISGPGDDNTVRLRIQKLASSFFRPELVTYLDDSIPLDQMQQNLTEVHNHLDEWKKELMFIIAPPIENIAEKPNHEPPQ